MHVGKLASGDERVNGTRILLGVKNKAGSS
jgi:hypothetical protein